MARPSFSPVINLGHLLQAIVLVIAIFTAYGNVDKRVALNQAAIVNNSNVHGKDNIQMQASQERIEKKLDRLIERGNE